MHKTKSKIKNTPKIKKKDPLVLRRKVNKELARMRRMIYAVTDRRIVLIRGAKKKQVEVRTLRLAETRPPEFVETRDGEGAICFIPRSYPLQPRLEYIQEDLERLDRPIFFQPAAFRWWRFC